MRRAAALARAAEAAQGLADALQELATVEQTGEPGEVQPRRGKPQRRRGVRIPADAPTVVDDVTAKRAQSALRRAGIVTR
jgi:hypothetical protein